MSDWKNYDKFIKGEYYPGAPKTDWRIKMEADFASRGISIESAPTVQRVFTKKAPVLQGESRREFHESMKRF